MIDWLRPLLMMFYAPARGMSEVRDRAPLAQAALLAWLAQVVYALFTRRPDLSGAFIVLDPLALFSVFIQSASSLLFVALIFVPIVIFFANLFERRASFRLTVQQEYAAVASTVFYAWAAASLAALPLAFIAKLSGLEAAMLESSEKIRQLQSQMTPGAPPPPHALPVLTEALLRIVLLLLLSPLPLLALWTVIAVRQVFRLSWLRAFASVLATSLVMFPVSILVMSLFSWVFASPFLLLLLFFLLRGYIGEVTRAQRARASFKRNLEAATLNPADASAHYNLGLIHLERKELDEARQRFERAVEIDADEVDAHYQLGRIARMQNRLADAIKHFEQVVMRAPQHAQHEIWREIGATYIAAGQFTDAHEALERFLDERPSDPEGLYLMGRALAGLGRQHEATESMRACIEAVKTAPAYKYRTDKRWLNEAQQFIKSSQ